MTPEFVADGFIKLIANCENGAVMVVGKDSPLILRGDYEMGLMKLLVAEAMVVNKLFGVEIFTPKLQLAVLFTVILLFLAIIVLVIFFII